MNFGSLNAQVQAKTWNKEVMDACLKVLANYPDQYMTAKQVAIAMAWDKSWRHVSVALRCLEKTSHVEIKGTGRCGHVVIAYRYRAKEAAARS